MQALLDYASFAPHGYCLLWNPWLIALHVGADLLIFVSYFAIPGALFIFLRQRPELRHRSLIALFAAFILLCGLTHLVSLATLWIPVYTAEGLLKLATGLVSATTAVILFRLIPRLVAIPSPHELAAANARLTAEVAAHEETFAQLRDAQRTLESKVEERTSELSAATEKLSVLSREAVHRSRNLLAVVSSIARQTGRGSADMGAFLESFLGRINALATATAALIETTTSASVPMSRLVKRQLEPVLLTFGERLHLAGPETEVNSQAAEQISLVLHELATNSQKHGVLSTKEGTVSVDWSVKEDATGPAEFVLTWQELGGVPQEGAFAGGFGSALLLTIAPTRLGGRAAATMTSGFHYHLAVPLSQVLPQDGGTAQAEDLARKIVDDAWGLVSEGRT